MRKAFGLLVIICSLPLLVFLFNKIGAELSSAQTFSKQFSSSVQLTDTQAINPTILKDENKKTFSEEYSQWRDPIELGNVPDFAKEIFVYSEDTGFYDHMGFDLTAIARAFMANQNDGATSQGGSTITQQLVRMRYLSQEKSYERKMLEIFYAYELEKKATKDEILNDYLNEMYFANGVYGIGGASTYYFNRPLHSLSKAEIAFIAAIPNNPSLYDPLRHFNNTKKRQERLLDKMVEKDELTEKEAQILKNKKITINIKQKKQLYPEYSTYVMNELRSLISQVDGYHVRFNAAQTSAEKATIDKELTERVKEVVDSGVVIQTALNPEKQTDVTKSANSILKEYSKLQAAATVINNDTREIVSVYAGKGYIKYDFNRSYQAKRQPGSAIKPLLDYGPYLEKYHATPDTLIDASDFCKGTYCPRNYDNVSVGAVTIENAFKNSYNTAAMRLFDHVGMKKAFSYLQPFTFDRATKRDLTYSAAIGGFTDGVSTVQMADAYTSFIDGSYTRAHAIRSVKTRSGKLLYEWPDTSKIIWSNSTVSGIRQMMASTVDSGTGQGISANSDYVGVKTGTTNSYKDFWITGLTNKYTSAVWLGYDTPVKMESLENDKIHHKLFNAMVK
ncbi:MAG: penicillin-binding protein [Kurthia sp.]|nr:penicillin-binding protein [Candidatus Kurthia equi]